MYFFNKILSYFAKPNFIMYDEWFDDNLEKTKLYVKNKKIKTISNIHQFFYEQSNYKVGASENNLQIDVDKNRDELFNNYYFENNSEKYDSLSKKNFCTLKKYPKTNLNLMSKKIYLLFIYFWLCIFFRISVVFYLTI